MAALVDMAVQGSADLETALDFLELAAEAVPIQIPMAPITNFTLKAAIWGIFSVICLEICSMAKMEKRPERAALKEAVSVETDLKVLAADSLPEDLARVNSAMADFPRRVRM